MSLLARGIERIVFLLSVRARNRIIAAGLHLPYKVQRMLLNDLQGPRGGQFQSIFRVQKATWKGYWISKDIRKMESNPLQWAEETADQANLIILYVHGGGFHIGSPVQYITSFLEMLDQFRNKHAMADVRFLSVEYSLSPEAAHPTALNECINAYRYLVHDLSVSPSRIVLAGDSAGGNLTAAMLLKLKNQRSDPELGQLPCIPLPAGAAMISPWVVFSGEDSLLLKDTGDDFVQSSQLKGYMGGYLPVTQGMDAQRVREIIERPDVSPFYGNFKGLTCRVLVTYGGVELLRDQIKAFIRKLEDDNVQVDVITRDDAAHTWIVEHHVCATKAIWIHDLSKWTQWCSEIISRKR
ncbi:Alpha/Beta hydrolase protein [Dichotomocladium elegans]|nr:Alpha/Beta hydrolase protein [Dichotomocladium elegans]